ncbi:MAG: 16S rRNA processing protein RimM [Bacteroidetes bacterium]|nr:MAG: 16S rRNA processing protein RimM [Bacteroidota bacterium]
MKTLNIDKLIPIGFINKTHGFQGELSIAVNEDISFSIEQFKSHFLFIQIDGLPVPFFVENIREKSNGVLVKFETIKDEALAKRLVGKKVFSEKLKEDDNVQEDAEPSWFDLVGYKVTDQVYGDLGPIIEIQELPMQFLAVCNINNKEILFPLHEEIILEINDDSRSMQIELPDGLLDVYLND